MKKFNYASHPNKGLQQTQLSYCKVGPFPNPFYKSRNKRNIGPTNMDLRRAKAELEYPVKSTNVEFDQTHRYPNPIWVCETTRPDKNGVHQTTRHNNNALKDLIIGM